MGLDKVAKHQLQVGQRLKQARTIAKLTRKDIEDILGIKQTTLNAWERGNGRLSSDKASDLVSLFKTKGVFIDSDWLLYGSHEPKSEENLTEETLNLFTDVRIVGEVKYFSQNNTGALTHLIKTDALDPLFLQGDYVGGLVSTPSSFKKLTGLFCLVDFGDQVIIPRKVIAYLGQHVFSLSSINPYSKDTHYPPFFEKSVERIAPITRHWLSHQMV